MTACRIRVGRETPVTGAFEWATLDGGGAVLRTGVSNLRQPSVGGECEVVVASDLVLLERVAAPAAQQRRVSSALRFLAEESAIPDPERLHVAAESAPARDTLCVAIVDQQWLAQTLSGLERAGLVARAAHPECLTAELLPHAWTVVCNGNDSFARTGEAEGFALEGTDRMNVPHSLRIALEGARKAGDSPREIVVRTAAENTLPDLERWAATLGIPVKQGPAWRWAAARGRAGIELLQGQFAPRRTEQQWVQRLRRPAILACALLVVASAGIAADWAAKARERRALLAEMSAVYRETFGERAVVVDAPLQMSRALAELRQRSGQAGPTDFLVLLGAVAERLLDPRKLQIGEISYDGGTLTVSLGPRDPAQTDSLLAELRAALPVQGLDIRVERADAAAKSGLRVTARGVAR